MNTRAGLVLNAIISISLLMVFYGPVIRAPNTSFFATNGDGLKDYYTTSFFLKYDNSWSHSMVMNYPHGEHVMFTGSQSSLAFPLKFISDNIVDLKPYTVGILNIAMLASIILGSVFLYLLLRHFQLNTLYSIAVAIGITFLSPQLARMGGHFSLSYVFAIPCILYLLAKYHEKPMVWKSLLMGLFMLWAMATHIYMLGFYAFIVLSYWAYRFVNERAALITFKRTLHFSVQFLLPLILFLLVTTLTDQVGDRTAHPWGFLVFRAYPASVLLPVEMPYGRWLHHFADFGHIGWEGHAYVGLVAAIGFFIMIAVSVTRFLRNHHANTFIPAKDHMILNVFFFISLLALLYSFGVPFIFGLDRLVEYIGPLKQMRGIARFSWLFFYVINLLVFYQLWHLKRHMYKRLWFALLLAAVMMLWYDAFYNVRFWSGFVNNEMPAISDVDNQTPINQWYHHINTDEYQAILPLPYFHVGSENIWIEPRGGIDVYSAIVSWKTGLPSMGVFMSRTSISQTISNCVLIWEPYRKPDLLKLMDPNKDILIIAREQELIPEPQQKLILLSEEVYRGNDFNLYRLRVPVLLSYYEGLVDKVYANYLDAELYAHNGYLSTSPQQDFLSQTFSENKTDLYYAESGSMTGVFERGRAFFETEVPGHKPGNEYILSFWVHGVLKDLFLRTNLIVEVMDESGMVYDYHFTDLFRELVTVHGDWGLIERSLSIKSPGDRVRLILHNRLLRNQKYTVDQIMLRAEDTDVYKETEYWLMRNNRYYKTDKTHHLKDFAPL